MEHLFDLAPGGIQVTKPGQSELRGALSKAGSCFGIQGTRKEFLRCRLGLGIPLCYDLQGVLESIHP